MNEPQAYWQMLPPLPSTSFAEEWRKLDPPLRSLIDLLAAMESYGESLPDFKKVFDPVVQLIAQGLVKRGDLARTQPLTAEYARSTLGLLLCRDGVANSEDEARQLTLSRLMEWSTINKLAKFQDDGPPREGKGKKRAPRGTINQRMLETLSCRPESRGWTTTQWVSELTCSRAAISKTPAWRELQHAGDTMPGEHAKDRRRK